jgi:hypothetical protein
MGDGVRDPDTVVIHSTNPTKGVGWEKIAQFRTYLGGGELESVSLSLVIGYGTGGVHWGSSKLVSLKVDKIELTFVAAFPVMEDDVLHILVQNVFGEPISVNRPDRQTIQIRLLRATWVEPRDFWALYDGFDTSMTIEFLPVYAGKKVRQYCARVAALFGADPADKTPSKSIAYTKMGGTDRLDLGFKDEFPQANAEGVDLGHLVV